MTDNIIEISKAGLRSIFTANKYDVEILDEDLSRILFIRNFIEESLLSVKRVCKGINGEEYFNELKKYALELFLTYCEESIPEEEKNSKDFNLEIHRKEDKYYFNYIYDNLEYPE
jgi:hypothetical protein